MLYCVAYDILVINAHVDDFISGQVMVLFVKLPCFICMHLLQTPEVGYAMRVMKFTHQQSHQFVESGAGVAFVLGLWSSLNSLVTLLLCIQSLASQLTVQSSIQYFVMLKMINEFPKLYFEAIHDNKLRDIMHHPPKYDKDHKKIAFCERSCFNMATRIIYKIFRAFYVAFIYYLVPFWLFVFIWLSDNDYLKKH